MIEELDAAGFDELRLPSFAVFQFRVPMGFAHSLSANESVPVLQATTSSTSREAPKTLAPYCPVPTRL